MSNDHPADAPAFDFDGAQAAGVIPEIAPAAANPTPAAERSGGDEAATPGANLARQGAAEFRVTRSGSPARRLVLQGHRYTIGSRDDCSIRLNDLAVRAMHAVMIRDAQQLWVRAYAVPIDINEQRVTEATLEVGDVMRLGGYRFELLSKTAPTAQVIEATEDVADEDDLSLGARRPAEPASAVTAPAGSAQSTAEETLWRERLRREVQRWRARQAECDRRDARCDRREEALRGRESALWSRTERVQRREAELKAQESAALQIQQEFADKQDELCRLREQTRARQQEFDRREAEFRQLQASYQSQIDEASCRLQQSEEQAAAAGEAVERMRAQFESLNRQLDELSEQQNALEQRGREQVEEHHRVRSELERARDEAIAQRDQADLRRTAAIEAKNEAEERQQELESRLEEVSLACQQARTECETERSRAREHEATAETLRRQVEELRESVARARDEAAQLRQDTRQANESIRGLEAQAEQTHQQHLSDRESWIAEAEQLRAQVENLSLQLHQATDQLSALRDANEQLSTQLRQVQQQSEQQRVEAESRPTHQAWQAKCEQLDTAHEQLAQTKSDYHDALAALSEARTTAAAETDSLRDLPDARYQPAGEPNELQPPGPQDAYETIAPVEEDEVPPSAVARGDDEPNEAAEPAAATDAEPDGHDSSAIPSAAPESDRPAWAAYETAQQDSDDSEDAAFAENALDENALDENALDGTSGNQESSNQEAPQWPPGEQLLPGKPFAAEEPAAEGSDLADAEAVPPASDPHDASVEEESDDEAWPSYEPYSPAAASTTAAGVESGAGAAADPEPEAPEDDSIEAYMNRLLRRVQGESAGPYVAPSDAPGEAAPAPAENTGLTLDAAVEPKPEAAQESAAVTESPEVTESPDAAEPETADAAPVSLSPRSRAPEKATNLSAMRALANESARSAITRSVRVQTRDTQLKALLKFGQAAIAIACGIAAFLFVSNTLNVVAALAAFVIAGISISEGVGLLKDAHRRLTAARARAEAPTSGEETAAPQTTPEADDQPEA